MSTKIEQSVSDQPSKKDWDYPSYAAIPNDGLRHEILRGEHYVNAAPNLYHQEISRRMQFQLYSAIELNELGVVINAPVDVQLSEHDIVQPDLVIITKARRHIMTPTRVRGIPDLLIEISSPSNPNHDLVDKRSVYLLNGVPEYWIVSPEDHQITQLVLKDDQYLERICTDEIKMHVPPNANVDLRRVW